MAASTRRWRPASSTSADARDARLRVEREDHVGEWVAVERSRVLAAHRAQFAGGHVSPCPLDDHLRVGPAGVAVGIVDLHHDVLDTDAMPGVYRRWVVEGAEPEVALHHLGRPIGPTDPVSGAVDDVIE